MHDKESWDALKKGRRRSSLKVFEFVRVLWIFLDFLPLSF